MTRLFNNTILFRLAPVRIFNQPFILTVTVSPFPGLLARQLMGEPVNLVEYVYFDNDQVTRLHLPVKVSKVRLDILETGNISDEVMIRIADTFKLKMGNYLIANESDSPRTISLETTDGTLSGKIGAQYPDPGTVTHCDESINVYTYQGGVPQRKQLECKVPDLRGLDIFSARSIAAGHGFHGFDQIVD